MPKFKLSLLIVLALVLSACKAKPLASPTPVPPTRTPAPVNTLAPTASGPASCTVVSLLPTPGPTERSLFPPVSDDDWLHGSEDADITVIEYSDFQ
ncbi:MAG: hypothetical protein EHM70_05185 [Chloroflexota bacterium]|nr:MAG: hypothetical protein EHM70_05185 [Chloroflexota bacterium]